MSDKPVCELPKNAQEKVRFRLGEYKGYKLKKRKNAPKSAKKMRELQPKQFISSKQKGVELWGPTIGLWKQETDIVWDIGGGQISEAFRVKTDLAATHTHRQQKIFKEVSHMGGRGSGGHNRRPNAEKKLKGTYRKDRDQGKEPSILEQMWKGKNLPGSTTKKPQREQPDPKPPKGLGKKGRELWKRVTADYDFSQNFMDQVILEGACKTLDLIDELEKVIKEEGAYILKGGVSHPHPAHRLWMQAGRHFLKHYKDLNLV